MEDVKVEMGFSPVIMRETFQNIDKPVYKLRSGNHLRGANTCTVPSSSESIVNSGAKIRSLIPQKIKASNSLDTFKKNLERWCPFVLADFSGPMLVR